MYRRERKCECEKRAQKKGFNTDEKMKQLNNMESSRLPNVKDENVRMNERNTVRRLTQLSENSFNTVEFNALTSNEFKASLSQEQRT